MNRLNAVPSPSLSIFSASCFPISIIGYITSGLNDNSCKAEAKGCEGIKKYL